MGNFKIILMGNQMIQRIQKDPQMVLGYISIKKEK
jgi:hypothetical protein